MPKDKDKERILKAATERKLVFYKGTPIRMFADFSMETLQARRNIQSYEKQESTTSKAFN